MEAAKKSEYSHGEAYALMWYACSCGHRERIHNSRDGVTPFGLACPSCGKPSLRHVDWNRDECRPDYSPFPGQRYFANGTTFQAEKYIERRIKMFADAGQAMPDEIAARLRYDARAGIGEWHPGWPAVNREQDR